MVSLIIFVIEGVGDADDAHDADGVHIFWKQIIFSSIEAIPFADVLLPLLLLLAPALTHASLLHFLNLKNNSNMNPIALYIP